MLPIEDMELLIEQMEKLDGRTPNGWKIERKFPIAIVVTFVAQIVMITWFAAEVSGTAKTNHATGIRLEREITQIKHKIDTLQNEKINNTDVIREIDRLEHHINFIEKRLNTLDHR